MRVDARVYALAAAVVVLLLSMAILFGYLPLPSLTRLAFAQGVLAILVVALAYFVLQHQSPSILFAGRLALVRSAMIAVVLAAILSASLSVGTALVRVAAPKVLQKASREPIVVVSDRPAEPVVWTQFGLGADPQLIARALIDKADDCPWIEIDRKRERMPHREDSRAAVFGKMCETRVTLAETLKVKIWQGSTLLLDQQVTRKPERIAMLGDTGCRLTFYEDQGCRDYKTWPFARVAEAIVDKKPDLILHLGDYYYREAPCLASSTNCDPGPYGDSEEAWRADFFGPARTLLARAPWVFVRGNHENCDRGGFGWFYYLGDSAVSTAACDLVHTPAHIRLNGLSLVNFDTAFTDNKYIQKSLERNWADLAAILKGKPPATANEPILLMTHEPGYFACLDKGKRIACPPAWAAPLGGVRDIADATRGAGWRAILLSGHVHDFQTFDVPASDGKPSVTQVIVGTGGANQDPTPSDMLPPAVVDIPFPDSRPGPPSSMRSVVGKAQGWPGFGFGLLSTGSVELVMYDVDGKRQFACDLAAEMKVPRCR